MWVDGGVLLYWMKHFVEHFVCMKSATQIKSDWLIEYKITTRATAGWKVWCQLWRGRLHEASRGHFLCGGTGSRAETRLTNTPASVVDSNSNSCVWLLLLWAASKQQLNHKHKEWPVIRAGHRLKINTTNGVLHSVPFVSFRWESWHAERPALPNTPRSASPPQTLQLSSFSRSSFKQDAGIREMLIPLGTGFFQTILYSKNKAWWQL